MTHLELIVQKANRAKQDNDLLLYNAYAQQAQELLSELKSMETMRRRKRRRVSGQKRKRRR